MTEQELKKLEKARRIAAHPGNAPEYSFDRIERRADSPWAGRSLCALGASVTRGARSEGFAVGEYLAARFGFELTKEAVSGTTISDLKEDSFIERMLAKLPRSAHFDLFLCQLPTNDARLGFPLGEIAEGFDRASFDRRTVTGGIEFIVSYVRETWGCPVVFYTGSRYDNENYGRMVERLGELSRKWNFAVLDLWHGDEFNALPDAAGLREVYMADPVHPTRAGYRDWWGPEMERQLLSSVLA